MEEPDEAAYAHICIATNMEEPDEAAYAHICIATTISQVK